MAKHAKVSSDDKPRANAGGGATANAVQGVSAAHDPMVDAPDAPGYAHGQMPPSPEAAGFVPMSQVELKPKWGKGRVVGIVFAVLLALAAAALGGYAAYLILLQPVEAEKAPQHEEIVATTDADLSTAKEEAEYLEAHKGRPKVFPLVAQCQGIDVRSPIAPADLTGVLFHQASYPYALVLDTALPDANLEEVGKTRQPRVNREQFSGEWLDADAMHIWRTGDTTAMDTSIDVGAAPGTTLRSPVTGTVVLVKDYLLYNETPDIEIHIQPDGRPDLDVVLIHTENPLVKAGERVDAGVTELSHVRDIAAHLTDVQLGFYTPPEDAGNHTHVQVNNADYGDYREKKLEGAVKAA